MGFCGRNTDSLATKIVVMIFTLMEITLTFTVNKKSICLTK